MLIRAGADANPVTAIHEGSSYAASFLHAIYFHARARAPS
jgi:hypothetical protein